MIGFKSETAEPSSRKRSVAHGRTLLPFLRRASRPPLVCMSEPGRNALTLLGRSTVRGANKICTPAGRGLTSAAHSARHPNHDSLVQPYEAVVIIGRAAAQRYEEIGTGYPLPDFPPMPASLP